MSGRVADAQRDPIDKVVFVALPAGRHVCVVQAVRAWSQSPYCDFALQREAAMYPAGSRGERVFLDGDDRAG